jgi:hypothetical protein
VVLNRDGVENKSHCLDFNTYLQNNKSVYYIGNLPGNYSIQVSATSLSGPGPFSNKVVIVIEETQKSLMILWKSLPFAIVIVFLALFLVRQKKKIQKLKSPESQQLNAIVSNPDPYELQRADIQLLTELGKGEFGIIYGGLLKKSHRNKCDFKVAIKTVSNETSIVDSFNFLKEAEVMKQFDTFHIVKLIGIVSDDTPFYVVMVIIANLLYFREPNFMPCHVISRN